MSLHDTVPFLMILLSNADATNFSAAAYCEHFKHGPSIDVRDMVGEWMTVYTQPKTVTCFTMNIRATTELEREQLALKYGTFGGRCDWSQCLLQLQSTRGKHFLQGDGSAGLLLNVVIEEDRGRFALQEQNPDQWSVFGRRGSELLLMRDCSGEAAAIFARAPYWPAPAALYAALHRGGVRPLTGQRAMCAPTHYCRETRNYAARAQHDIFLN